MADYKSKSQSSEVESERDTRNKKRPKSKGRNRSNSKKRDANMNQAKLDSKGRDNHPGYYVISSELAEQASQLAFQSFVGHGTFDGYQVPTIMILHTMPNPGITAVPSGNGVNWRNPSLIEPSTLSEKVGINLMMTKLFALLSTFSGRTTTYGPQDVGIMLLALSSVIELAEHIRRAFGILLTYNPRNRVMPTTLLEALGFDAQDLMENVANYRMRFNTAMTRVNQIPILDNVAYLHKSMEIYQNIYQDDPSSMAQLFAWVPNQLWNLDETSDPNGSILQPITIPNHSSVLKKMSAHLSILELMISKLLESSTLNIIYADLLNMGNKLNVPTMQFDYLAENYVVKPVYNVNACLQAHNSFPTGGPATFSSNKVTSPGQNVYTSGNVVLSDANNNALIYNPVFLNLWNTRDKRIIDMFTDTPKVEDRIEVTRFLAAHSGYGVKASDLGLTGQQTYAVFPALPDHYIQYIDVFGNSINSVSAFHNGGMYYSTGSLSPMYVNIGKLGEATPMLETYDANWNLSSVAGDLHFYTEVDYHYLRRLNDFYNLGLWDFRV